MKFPDDLTWSKIFFFAGQVQFVIATFSTGDMKRDFLSYSLCMFGAAIYLKLK